MFRENLPQSITHINKLCHNLWWSWNQESYSLFERMDELLWQKTRNPVKVLNSLSERRLEELSQDKDFVQQLNQISGQLEQYLEQSKTWFNGEHTGLNNELIAYFSAEYGIHESLPIYSGGLGVLSGDHVKSASDLGVPMVFVGLFYENGYFLQKIDEQGQQVDEYEIHPPKDLPIKKALSPNSQEQLSFTLDFPEREVHVNVWEATIGRVKAYLLDSNHPKNSEEDKRITARLYGGDREMRISQEIILGIGGIKALEKLQLTPTAFHMNEGHSGFFQIERIRQTMEREKLSFEEAKIRCASNCVFTTHTPVPAGNEVFELPLMHKYFYERAKELGISWHRFLDLGLVSHKTDYKYFSLTVFALNVSRFFNGVSELHGRIAKKMWRGQWPDIPEAMNPITHITNGIHVQTWMALETKQLLSEHLDNDWREKITDPEFWNKVKEIPYSEIQSVQKNLKVKMIELTRRLLKQQLQEQGCSRAEVDEVSNALDPNALTIGFARRFATYKRANLIFKDLKRLEKIVHNPERPVQFIFAGKAHPADVPGQEYIKEIYEISRRPEFRGKVIILENYDMNISSHMVAGVDVWLNNPRRPMEASGTSGQKVPINFGLNFSVLDGWWREGYNGKNGWVIGKDKDYPSQEVQDFEDANDFYNTLEETILPLYYQKENSDLTDNGLSQEWIEMAKESFRSNIAEYSMLRVVKDYTNKLYIPAITYGKKFRSKDGKQVINDYLSTRRFLQRNWKDICVQSFSFGDQYIEVGSNYDHYKTTPEHHVDFQVDDTIPGRVFEATSINADVNLYLGDLNPEQLRADLIETDTSTSENQNQFKVHPLKWGEKQFDGITRVTGEASSSDKNPKRWRLRITPRYEGLAHEQEFSLCTWL